MAAECQLMAGSFAAFIQFLLFVVVLTVLALKRQYENPKRSLQIWGLDVAKQIVGGFEAHSINILIALILDARTKSLAGDGPTLDSCIYYFINFSVDTSVGVFLNIILLRCLTKLAMNQGWTSLQKSGAYGTPVNYTVWLKQLAAWLLIIPGTKLILLAFIYVLLTPLSWFGYAILGWLQPTPKAELLVVMIACPVAMNCVQYWVQDNWLKKTTKSNKERKEGEGKKRGSSNGFEALVEDEGEDDGEGRGGERKVEEETLL
jgi:hypothetical protein